MEPNRYRLLESLFAQPMLVAEYIEANCSTQTVGGPGRDGEQQTLDFGYDFFPSEYSLR